MTKIQSLLIIFGSCTFTSTDAQSKYLSDIIITNFDVQYGGGYTGISFNYWRYDTCLYSKQMCKYNTSTAASVKISSEKSSVIYELLRRNVNGYPGHNEYDTLKYFFISDNISASQFVRKLLIKDTYRTDTFSLSAIDTLQFDNYTLIKKIFGKSEVENQKSLKVYVLKSVDEFGSTMLHYWVERIGVIKLTDEKCWRYSFEINDNRTKAMKKMFAGILKLIKVKYKDPYWLGEPCGVEQ